MTQQQHTATVELEGDRSLIITREFDAPKQLVWRAFTDPELVKRWWAGQRGTVTLAEIDLRVGGKWRYVMEAEGGFEVGFHGEYLEIVEGERVVSTEAFEGLPDCDANASRNTMTLKGADGRTTMTVRVEHRLPEHRTGHLESGMEGGMQESFAALEQVARSLA